jgi:prepilin-type N-terminal cleavage/methylation domain-containing protein
MKHNKFTIIELLVVVAIVSIIASMVISGVSEQHNKEINKITITAKITKTWDREYHYYITANKTVFVLDASNDVKMFGIAEAGKLYKITYYVTEPHPVVLQLNEITAEAQ